MNREDQEVLHLRELIRKIPDGAAKRIPEKVRVIVNARQEYRTLAEAILLAAYLVETDRLDLTGYIENPDSKELCRQLGYSEDGNFATILRDPVTGDDIINTHGEIR